MAVNIGEAVGMSTILPSDQGRLFSSIIGRNKDRGARENIAKAKKQESIIKPSDFKVEYSQWNLPALADKERDEQMAIYDQIARGVSTNDVDFAKSVAAYKFNNAERKSLDKSYGEYISNPNYIKEQGFIKIASDPKSTWDDVYRAAESLRTKGFIFTPEGRGRIAPTLNYTPKLDFKPDDYDEVIATDSKGNPIIEQAGRNGDFYYVKKKVLKDEPKQLAFEILTQRDPKWHDVLTYGLDDATLSDTTAVQNKIADESRKLIQAQEEGGYRLDLRAPYRPPQASAAERNSKPRLSGNTATLGNAKWTFYSEGDTEIWTPSRTDVSENKVLDFEDGKGNIVKGRVKSITSDKGGTPVINVITVVDEVETEVAVPYKGKKDGTGNNIGKIKNEFNADPYQIKKLITGSLEHSTEATTGTTATGVKSSINPPPCKFRGNP